MWDSEYGGFFWEVHPTGREATLSGKHVYGQAFGLYALSEYARASSDPEALKTAQELFTILERKAHDKKYGGYYEFFSRDWLIEKDLDRDYINYPTGIKTFNTHIHIIEALASYYTLSKDETLFQRLNELSIILSNSVVRKLLGFCTDRYEEDWNPILDTRTHLVNYGHDLENISLLIMAYESTGGAVQPLLELFETIFGYSLKYGYDRMQGGFYRFGSINAKAYRREKNWWVQAEGLLSALLMYNITRREAYFNCFAQTLVWINRHQVDWEIGEWFEHVSTKGTPFGPKAGPWKTPYHTGRAMLECINILESLK
jgi:mannobiose 2-epimerase